MRELDAVADRLAKAAGPLLRNPHLADGVGLQQGSQGLGAEPSPWALRRTLIGVDAHLGDEVGLDGIDHRYPISMSRQGL